MTVGFAFGLTAVGVCGAEEGAATNALAGGEFRWRCGPPVLSARDVGGDTCHSAKDPSIVRHNGRWHLFLTVRGVHRSHTIQYLSFEDWRDAAGAPRTVLPMHPGYFCAPQVFFFTPARKWYLLCQASDESWEPKYQPAFSTSDDLSKPAAWTPLTPLVGRKPAALKGWLDFWVICDETKAHLFFTSNDGRMWRMETRLQSFPGGWSEPVVALQGDLFEASHTYRLKGRAEYLTIVEAQSGHGWRYQKAYLADRLDGPWRPLAAERDRAFASMTNVKQTGDRWTDSVSHGEMLRAGVDEKLVVDPADLRFLFQGVLDRDRAGKPYGEIPWRLGLLESVR